MIDMEWKHRITARKTPVILCAIMFSIFFAITLWLYSVQNGAFLFTGIFSGIMVLLLGLTTHRLIFFKVLIGQHEFYYQTNPFNGIAYSYRDVAKAWVSDGSAQNGAHQAYCNIEIRGGRTIRFMLDDPDDPGIKFLIRQIQEEKKVHSDSQNQKDQEYIIDGKVFGKTKIAIGIVIVLLILFFDFAMAQATEILFLEIAGIIMAGYVLVTFICNYAFFKVHIGQERFYYRTNPFNARSFRYEEIIHCRLVRKIVQIRRRGRADLPRYYFFLEFTDRTGTKRRFRYEKPIHGYEVQVLKERIEKAQGRSFGDEVTIR